MIKKTLLAILVVQLFTCLNLQSQSIVSYGVKGGINFSNSTHDNMGSRIGYNVGLIAHRQYSSNFFLRSGIEFTTKGAKSEENWIYIDLVNNRRTWNYQLNYLQVPIVVGYKFSLNESTNLLVNIGPYLSYGIYASEKYCYSDSNKPNSAEPTYGGWTEKGFGDIGFYAFDLGLTGGLAIEYNKYLVSVNYEAGLINTMKALEGSNPSWKNQNLSISIGYFFKK